MSTELNKRLKIAMVGYHNTLPFTFGLNNQTDYFDIQLDIPSKCMGYYIRGEADVALVPVGALEDCNSYKIITDYCIGCDGAVDTVCLYTDTDINEVSKIYLDAHSRSSQLLTKVLADKFWKINPYYEVKDVDDIEALDHGEAVLMIGDKVFSNEQEYRVKYDLGEEWKKHTGLPFVFAVWIANKDFSDLQEQYLNELLGKGVQNINAVVQRFEGEFTTINLKNYFCNHIDYNLDDEKTKALSLFMKYIEEFNAVV